MRKLVVAATLAVLTMLCLVSAASAANVGPIINSVHTYTYGR